MKGVQWLLILSVCAAGCASSTAVTRNVGGRLVRGRFITDDAYAAYLRGALLEAQGKHQAALSAYIEGARQDPDSPELLTRIGALRCVDDGTGDAKSSPGAAFDRAASVDPAYEEAWTERARCHLKRGELEDAEQAARVAVSLDPDRIEPAVLLALVLERRNRIDDAARWLDGLVIREPASIEAAEAMLAFALRTNDLARRAAAECALGELGSTRGAKVAENPRPSLIDVDRALTRGAFDQARRLALTARLSSGALSLRAAAVGAATFAKEQADLVLAADPSDGDARVAAAVAADLLRDDDALARAMIDGSAVGRAPLSPLARALMAELLDRRIGPDAKKAWLDAFGAPLAEGDPLVRDVSTRH